MAEPRAGANRVVIAMMDGSRLKGFVYNFSPNSDFMHIFPTESSDSRYAKKVNTADCKAVFFVKTHEGNKAAREAARKGGAKVDPAASPVRGTRIRIHFRDGEVLVAATEAYSPTRLGFFALPLEADSNNQRIFVVNANVKQVVTGPAVDSGEGGEQERLATLAPSHNLRPPPPDSGALPVEGRVEAVLRVLNGESADSIAEEIQVPAAVILFWTETFLRAGRIALGG